MEYIVYARYFMLVMVALAAVIDDYRRYKISNRIILTGLILAVCMYFIEMYMVKNVCEYSLSDKASETYYKDAGRMYISGMVMAFVAGYMMYMLKGIGAGDVKLLTVAGMFIGINDVLYLCGVSLVAGVIIGVVEAVRTGKFKYIAGINMHKFHFSYAILSGVIIMVCIKLTAKL